MRVSLTVKTINQMNKVANREEMGMTTPSHLIAYIVDRFVFKEYSDTVTDVAKVVEPVASVEEVEEPKTGGVKM